MGQTRTAKAVNLRQLAGEIGDDRLSLFEEPDGRRRLEHPSLSDADLAARVAAHAARPDELGNATTTRAAVRAARAELQTIADAADLPAGTLTAAQMSAALRQLMTNQKTLARGLKRLGRLVLSDHEAAD